MQTDDQPQNRLRWIEEISRLMDNRFRIPGTNFRFGLDPLLNLVPGLGAISGFAVSGGLLFSMAKYGASGKVLILMIINIVLDAVVGAIPVLGWIFDFTYKANIRNVKLLKEHYTEGKHHGSGKGLIFFIGSILILLTILVIYLIWQIIEWVAGML